MYVHKLCRLHKNLIWSVLFIFCIVCIPATAWSAKWQSIPPELLSLQGNPYDSGAGALVIFNDGAMQIFFKDDVWTEMQVYRRIKIFNEDGKRHATVEIPYGKSDKIRDIKARTILPNGQKIDLKPQDIHDTPRVSGYGRYAALAYGNAIKFTLPSVEDGAIIEYQYVKKSEDIWFLDPWVFQYGDYTLSSTLKLTVPKELQYKGSFVNLGQEPKSSVEKWIDGRGTTYTWQVENLPGIRQEPKGPQAKHMLAKMQFVFTSYYSEWDRMVRPILEDWKSVSNKYGDAYKKYMGRRGQISKVVQELTDGVTDPGEKAARIYDYIQRNIQYVNLSGVGLTGKYSGEILAGKQAENVDMNVLLCAMLDEADIDASVAMLAPLDGQPFNSGFPSPVQFNRLITMVTDSQGEMLWLDPVIKGAPYGVLPWQSQSTAALLMDGSGQFLKTPKMSRINKETRKVNLSLTPDGQVTVEGTISAAGENAIPYRKKYAYSDADEQQKSFLSHLQNQVSGAEITTFAYQDQILSAHPVELNFEFSGTDYGTVAGKRLLLNPTIFERIDQDVIPPGERTTAIILGAANTINDEVLISIPEGFTIEQLPSIVVARSPFGRFMASYSEKSEGILYKRLLTITNPIVGPDKQEELRTFFDRVSQSDQQQIILSMPIEESD